MKPMMKRFLLASAAALALLGSQAAVARVDVGISIGIPGVIYAQPDYYYPPVPYVASPRVIIVPERHYHRRPVHVYEPPYYRGQRHYKHNRHGHRGHNKHHRRGRDHHR